MTGNRERFLRVHGITAKAWSKRYGIEPCSAPCYRCGAECVTSVPFAAGQFRGLVAPDCACGHPTPPCCIVRASGGDLFR